MQTFLTQIRKLKLAHGNKINSIERKAKRLEEITKQLDWLYHSNPLKFEHKIHALEAEQKRLK